MLLLQNLVCLRLSPANVTRVIFFPAPAAPVRRVDTRKGYSLTFYFLILVTLATLWPQVPYVSIPDRRGNWLVIQLVTNPIEDHSRQ